MPSDALTNVAFETSKNISSECLKLHLMTYAGKHASLNIASGRNQQYTKDSAFLLAQMRLYVMTLRKFLPFVRYNVN